MAPRAHLLGFLAGLAVIDGAIVLAVGLVPGRAAPGPAAAPAVAPAVTATGTRDAGPPPPLWKDVDPEELGRRVADLQLNVRRRLGKGQKRVLLAAPRRVGDDVELRVSLARASTFPAGLYCFHCPAQRCLFPEPTLAALEALAGAFDPDGVTALAARIGKEHVQVTFVGGASAGPIVPRSDAQLCDGPEARIQVRVPPAFDEYDAATCGSKRCELAGSGETLDVGAGPIDDNRRLACLRALCTGAAAPGLLGVPVRHVGELAFEQGGAFRSAEVVVTLRGVAAAENRDAYVAFWSSLTRALGDER